MRRLAVVLVVMVIVATACSSEAETNTTTTQPFHSLLELPDALTVHYADGVTPHEKEIIEFALDSVDKYIFEASGIEMVGEMYVTVSWLDYKDKAQQILGQDEETAERMGRSSKGVTITKRGIVIINLELIRALHASDDPQQKELSFDYDLFYVIAHEWYHAAQGALSFGWNGLSNLPSWFAESTANMAAEYTISAATCTDLGELSKIGQLKATDCTDQEIMEKTYNSLAYRYMTSSDPDYRILRALFLYLIPKYGVLPVNDFYRKLGNYAASLHLNGGSSTQQKSFQVFVSSAWQKTILSAYGVQDQAELFSVASSFVDEQSQSIEGRAILVLEHTQ